MSANDRQVGGNHYKRMAIQPWDFTLRNDLGHAEATAIEYIARWREKGGIEDLRKAIHWIEKKIEVELEKEAAAEPPA